MIMKRARSLLTLLLLVATAGGVGVLSEDLAAREASFETRLRRALGDRATSLWIYDDLEAAHAQALATGKPLLVTLRCVP